MSAPEFYIVADGNAYALDEEGTPFGVPVFNDGTVDWDCSFDFDPADEDLDYVAHVCYHLQQVHDLTKEHHQEVFVK